MNKINNLKEFIEKVDSSKKLNPKDLSSDQDLTIAIMNLISIEEHLAFSGSKTEKTSFYDLIEEIRELRKELMLKIIPSYEGEVWCISKHLLASSMRLMEVGTKQLNLNNKNEAYKFFNQSYNLYCMFWGLNMNMLNIENVKWVEDKKEDIKKLSEKIEKTLPEINEKNKNDDNENQKSTFSSKIKSFVKKAIDCCIE